MASYAEPRNPVSDTGKDEPIPAEGKWGPLVWSLTTLFAWWLSCLSWNSLSSGHSAQVIQPICRATQRCPFLLGLSGRVGRDHVALQMRRIASLVFPGYSRVPGTYGCRRVLARFTWIPFCPPFCYKSLVPGFFLFLLCISGTCLFSKFSAPSDLGYSTGEGNGKPLQYSCLENPMDGGAW